MSRSLKNHHRELIELAALFMAAGLTDVFTDVLGHRIEGPSILIALGAIVAAVSFARHRPGRRGGAAVAPPRGVSASLSDRTGGLAGSSDRLWRVRAVVEDRPGRLAVLAGAFAAVGANILTLEVHPVGDEVVDEFLVQAAVGVTPQQLSAAVAAAGGGQVHVETADVTALADVPTRALTLARQLAGGPDQLGRVLAELLGATDVTWRPCGDALATASDGGSGSGTESIAIAVGGPQSGVLVVSRPQTPFTFVEFARAQAMADLARTLHPIDGVAASI
jgi:hypothetical protein